MNRAPMPAVPLSPEPVPGGLGPVVAPLVVLSLVVIVPVGLVLTLDRYSYDVWGIFVWAPLTVLAALPLCRFVARRTAEPDVVRFLMGAALLKIVVGSVAQYGVVELFYDGRADASRYDRAGRLLAGQLRALDFTDLGKISGTRFLEVFTGAVQAVIGDTKLGTFVVFSFFGFVGMCLLYLAFCEALPGGDRRLYRRLLFLMPSMWFWPSTIGKEAFLMLCLGTASYGLALAFSGRLAGIVAVLFGGWGMAVVRPHLVLIFLVGVLVAAAFGDRMPSDQPEGRASSRALGTRVALALVALALAPPLLDTVERFFEIEGINLENVNAVRDEVAVQTDQGGSEFAPPDTGTPVGFVFGIVTVVLRPFPWEADGTQLLSALESAAFAVIAVVCIARRWSSWPRALWRRWCRFSWAYAISYAWAFAVVANFGLLARQRSLMLPMLFVVVACTQRVSPDPVPAAGRRPPTSEGSVPLPGRS